MRLVQQITEDDKTVRTQITLTEKLKKLVEKYAKERGESLSEYLRKAASLRVLLEKEEEKDLDVIASRLIGSLDLRKHPEWQPKQKLQKWVRRIRQEW